MNPNFDKREYKKLQKLAVENDVHTMCRKSDYYNADYNGLTIAYCLASDREDARMVMVAVSYCAPEDDFSKKHGKFTALSNLMYANGRFIYLPLGEMYRNAGPEAVGCFILETLEV